MSAVTSAAVTYVPVGLFGLQMNTSRVFGVTALAMAGRVWRRRFNPDRAGCGGDGGEQFILSAKTRVGLLLPRPPSLHGPCRKHRATSRTRPRDSRVSP